MTANKPCNTSSTFFNEMSDSQVSRKGRVHGCYGLPLGEESGIHDSETRSGTEPLKVSIGQAS